jgi:hypothetical protein
MCAGIAEDVGGGKFVLLSCSWTLRSKIWELLVDRRGEANSDVPGRGTGGGEELDPTDWIGDCVGGEGKLEKTLGAVVAIGEKAVNWGSCGALALIGIVVFGVSSISDIGSSSGDAASVVGGESGFGFALSWFFFFFPNPKKDRFPLPWFDGSSISLTFFFIYIFFSFSYQRMLECSVQLSLWVDVQCQQR